MSVKCKKMACIGNDCVACGRCVKECPFDTIPVYKRSGYAFMGIQTPVEMDEHLVRFAVDRTVCFRILRRDANIDRIRIDNNDFVQTAFMVRLLPDGNHDAGNIQDQTQKG